MLNTEERYGALTKLLHWLIVLLFAFQYFAGHVMMAMLHGDWGLTPKSALLGLDMNNWFNWHKSIGLVVLAVVLLRLLNRTFNTLPAWAPTLTASEKKAMHHYERLLYLGMLVMPISGFVYTMAAGYGVHLFEAYHLPNPIGKSKPLGEAAKWVHIVSAWVIVAALAAHLFVVFRHQLFVRDNLLGRMWFGRIPS